MIDISNQLVQIISNTLSTLTILSCLFMKVPQIMNIRNARSSKGIYPEALVLEITGFSIVTLYNYTNEYNIMTYMEYPFILLQVYVMLYYVLKFKRSLQSPVLYFGVIVYIGLVVAFATGFLHKNILGFLVPFCTPLSGFAKVTYIYGIIQAGNADAVSVTTWVISVATNFSRLFTIYVDSADVKLMINFFVSTLLSLGVLMTTLYYQLSSVPHFSLHQARTHHHHQD